jgi:hypothetical protein
MGYPAKVLCFASAKDVTELVGGRISSPKQDMEDYLNTLYDRCDKGFLNIRQMKGQVVTMEDWISLDETEIFKFPADQDIYIAVATREHKQGGKEGIIQIPALWVDIDFKKIKKEDVDHRIQNFQLEPTMVVKSGGGYHLYWGLKTPAERRI